MDGFCFGVGKMTEQIIVNCDYDALVGLSYTVWNNIANYEIKVIETIPGYTKFKVNYFRLGELGTFEVKKSVDGCDVNFSNLSVFDNAEEWQKLRTQQINQSPGGASDEKMLLYNQELLQKM